MVRSSVQHPCYVQGCFLCATLVPMLGQLPNIALCMALCFVGWGGYYFFMQRRGIDFEHRYWITTIHFVVVGFVVALAFREQTLRVLADFSSAPIISAALFLIALYTVNRFLQKRFVVPSEYLARFPDRNYLSISNKRLISKSVEILAQQVFIVLLVIFLRDAGLSMPGITFGFMFLFALLHIPLIQAEWGKWPALPFIGAVIGFSLIFPVIILTIPYGFMYTFIIHWLFYAVLAIAFLYRYTRAYDASHAKGVALN